MFANNKIATSVKLALITSTTMGAFASANVMAADAGIEEVERIAVTGSRIKRSDMESSSPVTVINAEDILASGATAIDSVLQQMTATGGAMTNPGVNNGSGGNARIDLRGLGAQRTLVLVNGRRMIASGTGAASTVDLNTIPVSMIQRIEVLKDGASAVYGSDAVSGVVNIILKRDYQGFEANAQTSMSGHGDAEETSIDFTLGTTFDRGNLVVGVQYMERGEASQADRGFSECPIKEASPDELYCGGSSYTPGGTIWTEDGKYKGNPDNNTWDEYQTGEDDYNFSEASYLYTPMQRLNITSLGTFELSDDTTLFTETMYSKRWSEQQMAPQPIWFEFEYQDWMGNGAGEDNPFEEGETLSYGRRMTDIDDRVFTQVVDTVRLVAGAEGVLDNGWGWDVSYNFGRNDSVDRLENLVHTGAVEEDIANQEFNPLDQNSWTADNMAEYIYTEQNTGGSQMNVIAASLNGELAELPAGYLGFAAGIEHRKEEAWFIPDSLTSQGLANDPKVEPTGGSYTVNEAFVEFAIPVLANAPLAEQVDLSAAMRYFDYDTFGSDATWKLGLTWKMNDQLMLRSVASTAFRAPTVDELYGGASPSFEQITYEGAQDQAEVTVGGNENLTPEEADTFTVGLVYEPEWFEGFSATVDYYDIQITNAIASVDEQYIVDLCLAPDGSGLPINTDNPICQSSNIGMDNAGRISFDNGLQNIGAENTSGFDVNFAYSFDAAGLSWRTSLDTTILNDYTVEVLDDETDYAGLITSSMGGYAKVKSNLGINVSADNWDASYQARYIAGMDSTVCVENPSECYAPDTPSMVYHDVSGRYFLENGVTVSAGVNNLFDKEPPYYTGNNDSNTDPYTYDVVGRYFFVKANVKF